MNNINFVDLSGGQAVWNRMGHSGERFKREKDQVVSYCFKIKIVNTKTMEMDPFMYFVIFSF